MQENIVAERLAAKETGSFVSREQLMANICMWVVVLLWGVSFISIKIAVVEIPPITMALVRFLIASLVMGLLAWRQGKIEPVQRQDRMPMLWAGLCGITLYFFFENIGVKLTTAANASLIVMIVPILAILLDAVVFRTRLSPLKLAGVMVALGGMYLSVTANGQLTLESENFQGNMLMLGAMIAWVFYTLINKRLQQSYSSMALTLYQTVGGTVFLIPLAFLEYKEWAMFSAVAFAHVLFLAIGCSVLCYFLYMHVLKHLDVAITTLYLNLVPVIGVIGGYLILQETVLPIQLAGGVATIISIILINVDQYRQKAGKQQAG